MRLIHCPPLLSTLLAFGLCAHVSAQSPAPLEQPATARPAASGASGALPGSAVELRADNCLVKAIQSIRVPASAEGRITELMVTEGANVQAGDVLVLIDDTQTQLALQLRRAEERESELNALNDVNLRDAVNNEVLARAEAEAYKELRREGATPYWEMQKKIREADREKLRIELQQEVAKIQYLAKRTERELAEHELTRRQVVAPFAGFIENRIAQLGEWVQPGTPLLQLVQLDKLRVEGDIDALRYPGQIARGTPAKVLIYANSRRSSDNSQGVVELDARIGFVSSEIDLNHRYRVWVEIENEQVGEEWVYKPGMEADIIAYPVGNSQ